ncbi:uncharacterized protein [Ranitomeya imitator]|uniref:uncharacterized protein n=1 Tax=Ranitomeya imitator TaxID=111125 RepID=UPI0037E79A95
MASANYSREKEMILEQEDLILALTGDIVTIIAQFSFKNQITIANVTHCAVFWSRKDNGCGNEIYPITCTQRNEENIVFLKINNTDDSHNGFYCFSMEVSVGEYNFIGRKHVRSQLLVLEPSSISTINQTTEVEFMGPVIINCSFSVQDIISAYPVGDRRTLRTEVYWMVGEPRQHFVYHPNEDYIHPEYRGKTKLIGQSDLLLEDFHGPDNTKFYCRVAITFCLTYKPPNYMESILQEGPGTVVRVQDKVEPLTLWLQAVILALFALFAVLSFLVLFIICLKARKDEKRSNIRGTIVETIDSSVSQNSDYANIEELQKRAKNTNEKLLYGMVNKSEPRTTKHEEVSKEPVVVYSAVKRQRCS